MKQRRLPGINYLQTQSIYSSLIPAFFSLLISTPPLSPLPNLLPCSLLSHALFLFISLFFWDMLLHHKMSIELHIKENLFKVYILRNTCHPKTLAPEVKRMLEPNFWNDRRDVCAVLCAVRLASACLWMDCSVGACMFVWGRDRKPEWRDYNSCYMAACFHLQDPGSTAVNKQALFAAPLSLCVSE
jgi:hypothetical protein